MALVELCRRGRAAGHRGHGPVADVTLVLTDDPADHRPGDHPDGIGDDGHGWLAGLIARTLDGTPIPRRTAAVLCCDPRIRALVTDTDGTPLRLGRTQRLASPGQRTAIAVRDGGCCFPGCTAPASWTDAHHVTWWDPDGHTDVENLAPLCRRHHGVVHRRGWAMRALPGQRFEVVTPTGKVLACQRHGRAAHPERPGAPA